MTDARGHQDVAAANSQHSEGEASLRMKIGGMSCSFCTNTIRSAYERMDGVHEVGVSLAHEEGLIKYDPARVGPGELKQTLHAIGYTYRDPDKVRTFEDEDDASRTHHRAGERTVQSLVEPVRRADADGSS